MIFPDDANGNEEAADVMKRNNIVNMAVACIVNQINSDGSFIKGLLIQALVKDPGTEILQDLIKITVRFFESL